MPIRTKGRTQTDPRDLFRITTRDLSISSLPVDAYARVTPPDQSNKVLEALQSMGSVAEKYKYTQQRNEAEDKKDAEVEYTQDKYEHGLSDEQIREKAMKDEYYNLAHGGGFVEEFYDKAEAFERENWNKSNEEWETGLSGLVQEAIEGRGDSFVRGFLDGGGINVVDKIDRSRKQKVATQALASERDTVRKRGRALVRNAVNSPEFDISGTTDPDEIESMVQDRNKFIRSKLTQLQSEYKNLGHLSVRDVGNLFLDSVGEAAVREGRPDLLGFAYLPDQRGKFIMANQEEYAKKIDAYTNAAIQTRESQIKQRKANQEKANKASRGQLVIDIVQSLQSSDPVERSKAILAFKENAGLWADDLPEFRRLNKLVQEMHSLDGRVFAPVDDANVAGQLFMMGNLGKLTTQHILERSHLLSKSTTQALLKKVGTNMKREGGSKSDKELLSDALNGDRGLTEIISDAPKAAKKYVEARAKMETPWTLNEAGNEWTKQYGENATTTDKRNPARVVARSTKALNEVAALVEDIRKGKVKVENRTEWNEKFADTLMGVFQDSNVGVEFFPNMPNMNELKSLTLGDNAKQRQMKSGGMDDADASFNMLYKGK